MEHPDQIRQVLPADMVEMAVIMQPARAVAPSGELEPHPISTLTPAVSPPFRVYVVSVLIARALLVPESQARPLDSDLH